MTKTYLIFKRIFDFFTAIFGFLIFWPVLVIIAILIKLDSPGPVFFIQNRVTEKGKVFRILKFRSMVKNARKLQFEKDISIEKLITKTGRILRDTHLDELPQLINIFFGEMSVIGPRPLIAENELKRTQKSINRKKRYEVKVGVSGIEKLVDLMPDRKNKIFERLHNAEYLKNIKTILEYDLYYVKNVSMMVDFVLIGETIRLIFRKLKQNFL